MTETLRAYVGLGSNLQGPVGQVRQALQELSFLPNTRLHQASTLYRTPPMGPAGQPDYINAVAALDTQLDAMALLDELQRLETLHHRHREARWGPRTLDLDLLLYGDLSLESERLQLPHPGILLRAFVLLPLMELAPDLLLPNGQRIAAALTQCDTTAITTVEER